MARREQLIHPYTGEPLSQGRREVAQKKEFPQIDRIVVASGSERRQDLIRHAFGGSEITSVPLGENEPITTDTRKVVEYKLALARSIVREMKTRGEIGRRERVAIFAADTQSGPLRLNKKGVLILQHQSKVPDTDSVRRVLARMARASEETGEDPHFFVTSSSGVYFDPTDKKHTDLVPSDPRISVVFLDSDWVIEHATPEGFPEFLAESDQHHKSDSYTGGNGLYKLTPMKTEEAAAGMSIPVLTKMGAVTMIDDIPRNDPRFAGAFRNAVSVAAHGFDDTVLAAISPEIAKRAQSWGFIDRAEQYALVA